MSGLNEPSNTCVADVTIQ